MEPTTEAGRRWGNDPDWWLIEGEREQAIACIVAIEHEAAAGTPDAAALREAYAAEFPVGPPHYGHHEMCALILFPGSYIDPPDPCTCHHDAIERFRALLQADAPVRREPPLDVERLMEAFQAVQPGVYGTDWPNDDRDDFQFVDPRDHAKAIAAEYARLAAPATDEPAPQ